MYQCKEETCRRSVFSLHTLCYVAHHVNILLPECLCVSVVPGKNLMIYQPCSIIHDIWSLRQKWSHSFYLFLHVLTHTSHTSSFTVPSASLRSLFPSIHFQQAILFPEEPSVFQNFFLSPIFHTALK